MAAGPAILISNPGYIVGPAVPQTDLAVAPNFERFDGLAARNQPGGPSIQPDELLHPAGLNPADYAAGFETGGDFGRSPRPGQMGQPVGQVYTEGPLQGVVGTLGGQPLAVVVSDRLHRNPGAYTPSKWPTIQQRMGVGQRGPSELGVAQTVQLGEITSNPPVPGSLSAILAGLG